MSTVQCQCGSWVSTANAGKGGAVKCPTCGQTVAATVPKAAKQPVAPPPQAPPQGYAQPQGYAAPPGYPPQGYAPQPDPGASNGAAIIGFVLGLVSFFMCGLLSPFAIFFSIKGLKYPQNRGLAIAGLVIGIIEFIAFMGLIIYLIIVFVIIGGAVATTAVVVSDVAQNPGSYVERLVPEAEMISATEQLLEAQAQTVRFHTELNRRHLTQVELEQLVGQTVDLWFRTIVVESREGEYPLLMSLGKDGIRDTSDDIVYDWGDANYVSPTDDSASESPFGSEPNSGSDESPQSPDSSDSTSDDDSNSDLPMELREALYNIRNYGDGQTRAIQTLKTIPIEDQYRVEVLTHLLKGENQSVLRQSLGDLLERWVSPSELKMCVEVMNELPSYSRDFPAQAVVSLAIRFEQLDDIIPVCNHEEYLFRSAVRDALDRAPEHRPAVIRQCLLDFKDEDRQENALEYLAEIPVDESCRKEVCVALNPVLREYRFEDDAVNLLNKWGPVVENIETLKEVEVISLIGKIHDHRALEALGELLSDWPSNSPNAAQVMREIGTAAEPYTWDALESEEIVVQHEVVLLLKDIGTERSLDKLTPLLEEPAVKFLVQDAIEEIKRANRTPETW